jgi:Tol biopolymer transport system component
MVTPIDPFFDIIRHIMAGYVRGHRLGPYEILSPLGAGGMGEVYKARDTRLERLVAVKVLPADLAARPELRERMQREARAISSLSHPNICALYDVGSQDGVYYLIMELLEGETLAERLKKGRLPLEMALGYAIEIAGALEQAHRQGIVHRDLKPGNVMLTKSGTKLLDFGLAKVTQTAAKAASADGETALLTQQLTTEGTIMGTFQYMSPEHLEGKETDARSDIFAFGAVLYEMVSGRQAFAGTSRASLIAAILKEQPAAFAGDVGLAVLERVVRACLEKDPDERWQSAGDLRRELKWIAEGGGQGPGAGGQGRVRRTGWIAVAAATSVAIGMGWVHFSERASVPRVVRFQVGGEVRLASQVSVSPDGSKVAFSGQNAHGTTMLWVRTLDEMSARSLTGTEGALMPFWSPDSRSIGYFDPVHGKLKRIEAAGGQPQTLTDCGQGAGADWSSDGTILFAPGTGFSGGILRVSANGGTPSVVIARDKQNEPIQPRFLPDGKRFLYLDRANSFTAGKRESAVWVGALDSRAPRKLVATRFAAAFAPGQGRSASHLLFVRDGVLMAQEVDPGKFDLRGEATRVADAVATDGPYGVADFSVSREGTLVFNAGVHQHEVVWVDRSGNRIGAGIAAEKYAHPELAPDGRHALFELLDITTGEPDLWVLDLERGDLSMFEREGSLARILPDGHAVVWACHLDGKWQICRKPVGGAGRVETLWDGGEGMVLNDVSRDGRWVAFDRSTELWIVPLAGEQKPYRFYPSRSKQIGGQFSPDGKWIAYTTNETGSWEVYVQPFPATGQKWKVSVGGGSQPAWRRDGKELFYRTADGKMMSAAVKTAGGFAAEAPRTLFQSSADPLYPNLGTSYSVTADGQRFLINAAVDESRNPPITVVTNWMAGVKE